MGLYTDLEDKWYNLVDSLGLEKAIDKIDSVVPSFMLFIGMTAILVIFVISSFVLSGPRNFEAEIVVLSNANGAPIPGATITLSAECLTAQGLKNSGTTNSNGKLTLTLCDAGLFGIEVKKEGYQKNSIEVSITEGQSVPITLEEIITAKSFNSKIVDEGGKIIKNAKLKMVCVTNATNKKEFPEAPQKVQPAEGFDFELISGCTEIQLTATAQGYTDSKGNPSATHTLGQDEENYTFEMKEYAPSGKVEFEVEVDGKSAEGVTINITSNDYPTVTVITDSSGTAETGEIPAGDYRYVAAARSGASDANYFTLEENEVKRITIKTKTPSNLKKLYAKITDEGGSAIPGAKVSLFKMPDGNFYVDDTTNSIGIVQRTLADGNYSVVVKKIGYQTAIAQVSLKKEGDEPQQIILNQGGGTIKAKIIDETGEGIKGASVSAKVDYFAGIIEKGTSDSNGGYEFRYLPAGNYTIKASTRNSDGEASVSLASSQAKEITILLIISEGKINFNITDTTGKRMNADYELYTKSPTSTDFTKAATGQTKLYSFDTGMLKYGTEIKAAVSASGYFTYETMTYKIQKTTETSPIQIYLGLRPTTGLPNQNKVQMFLVDIYESSPLNGSKSKPVSADKILPNKTYHFLFDLALLDGNSGTATANFFVGPEEEKGLSEENPFKINGAYSIGGTLTVLSKVHESFEIPNNENIVDGAAKQANILLGQQSGPKIIPMVLVVQTDSNADGKTKIFYEAGHGEEKSIQYYKEYEFGKKFCTSRCPAFLISNYIKIGNADYAPMDDAKKPVLFIGENYKLKTIVENLLEKDIGTANIILESNTKTGSGYAVVFPVPGNEGADSNAATAQITLAPLSTSEPKEFEVKPKNTAVTAKISEYLSKNLNGENTLKEYEGSSIYANVQVKEKSSVQISLSPEKIEAGIEYPVFVVRTSDSSTRKAISASIFYSVNGKGKAYMGESDENGLLVTEFSALNLSKDTHILFSAEKPGMVPGTKEIIVKAPYDPVPEDEPEPECLSLTQNAAQTIILEVGGSGSFGINSACTEARQVYIQTDLPVNKKSFELAAGNSQTITITATPRDGLMGIYPVQVLAVKGTKYKQLGIVNVIINDPNSCFEISQGEFDFRRSETVKGTITNKCFAGRKDNFNPQMNIQTNSVSLEYDKPGIPEKITSTVTVMGGAPEGYISGLMKSNILHAADPDCDDAIDIPEIPQAATDEALESAAEACEAQKKILKNHPRPEPNLPETKVDPSKVWEPSEIKPVTGPVSEIIPTNPNGTSGAFADTAIPAKTEKLSFQEEGDPPEDGEEAPPSKKGDTGTVTGEITDEETLAMAEETGGCGVVESGNDVSYIYSKYSDPYCSPGYGAFHPPEADGDGFGSGPWWKLRGEGMEGSTIMYNILSSFGDLHEISDMGTFGEEGFFVNLKVEGSYDSSWGGCEPADLKTQFDWFSIYENISGRYEFWQKEFSLVPVEGKVYSIGAYDATPIPEWCGESIKPYDHSAGDTWTTGEGDAGSLYTLVCGYCNGFLDPEYAASVTAPDADKTSDVMTRVWYVFDENHPYVEFDPTGNIQYALLTSQFSGSPEAYIKSLTKYDGKPLPPDKDGLRYFLRNHQVYVEYVGTPTVSSNIINFSLTNNNLLGDEYSIITVKDWINGSEKETKAFQVKLTGNPSSCYSSDGTIGATGKGFSPRLLFDWDWADIADNQCDSTNTDYAYCDAAQFTISFFKKLYKINDYINKGKIELLPTMTSFYSYLIKDNYSDGFLNDFSEYYSNSLANADSEFTEKYNKFITEGRIKIMVDSGGGGTNPCETTAEGLPATINIPVLGSNSKYFKLEKTIDNARKIRITGTDDDKCATAEIRLGTSSEWIDLGGMDSPHDKEYALSKTYHGVGAVEIRVKEDPSNLCGTESAKINSITVYGDCAQSGTETGQLPKGGLYKVSIDYNRDNPNINSLLSQSEPNAEITVTFKLIQPAPNYNPLYETPFDGEVGRKNDEFARDNYGTSVNGGNAGPLKISQKISSGQYSGAMTTVNHTATTDISKLDKGIVLTYGNGTVALNPSQPTPIIWEIKADTQNVDAQYLLKGTINGSLPSKKWRLAYSSIGTKECHDFSDQHKTVFNDAQIGANKGELAWSVAKKGTIGLATVFFTPGGNDIRIAPVSGKSGSLKSYDTLMNGNEVTLNYFDAAGIKDYDSLEGLFKMVDETKLCISTGTSSELKLWWNPEYLQELASQIDAGTGHACK